MWFRIASFALLFASCWLLNSNWSSLGWPVVAEELGDGRRLDGGSCPSPADPKPLVVGYVVGVLWLFVGLAIVADELFVPSLDLIAEKWGLSEDVAGATLMAAGGSSPELFTSAVGTFLRSSVGFGAIVGSAVFNVLFVVGVSALSTAKPMQLTWWPMFRDSSYYLVTLIVLAIFFGVNSPQEIDWYEALILHGMYWLYVFIMSQNSTLFAFFNRFLCRIKTADEFDLEDTPPETNLFSEPTRFREGIISLLMKNKPFYETAGVRLVTRLQGRVMDVFSKYDKDGSGHLDASQLGLIFTDLGLEPTPVTTRSDRSVFSLSL